MLYLRNKKASIEKSIYVHIKKNQFEDNMKVFVANFESQKKKNKSDVNSLTLLQTTVL